MSERTELEVRFGVGKRVAEIKAFDTVGPEDCFDVLFKSVIHRYVTGEDLTPTITRDVKDWMIKTNLFV